MTLLSALDRSFVYPAPVFRPVRYLENVVATRLWALLPGTWTIEQSFRFERPQLLTRLELWAGSGKKFESDVEIALIDGGDSSWSVTVSGALWPRGIWLAIPVDMVSVQPGHSYSLRVRLVSPAAGDQINLMMNSNSRTYPEGETRTPEGSTGDLCFRLAFMGL